MSMTAIATAAGRGPVGGGNAYGFDFLRTEHTMTGQEEEGSEEEEEENEEEENHANGGGPSDAAMMMKASDKSDLEKQFVVIQFLQAHRSSGCLPPSIIYKNTGVDLTETTGAASDVILRMLQSNPKIRIEEIPDPENPSLSIQTYGYQAKFNNVRDRTGLLAQINRCKHGVPMRDLTDSYDGVVEDLHSLITAGDVLAVANPEDKDKILFPRGEPFIVELDGHVTFQPNLQALLLENDDDDDENDTAAFPGDPAKKKAKALHAKKSPQQKLFQEKHKRQLMENCKTVRVDVDPTRQVRRGEAVCVGGHWFRVSSMVREGVPLSEQPARAQAPPSVTLRKDLSKKNDAEGYTRPFDAQQLPLDNCLPPQSIRNIVDAARARDVLQRIASSHGTGGSSRGGGGGAGGTGASSSSSSATSGVSSVAGNAAAQLLSSSANASDPQSLANSFAAAVGASAAAAVNGIGNARRRGHNTAAAGAAAAAANPALKSAAQRHEHIADVTEAARAAASDPSLVYSVVRRHGCSKDVRDMYLATKADVPESELDLYNLMVRHKLIEAGEPMRRPRLKKKGTNLDNDGKPKKRRYYERKGNRITNTHLNGTEIGSILAASMEQLQQGKTAGDGGM